MIAYVKKANNRGKTAAVRDAFNQAMNDVMLEDGSFDLDRLLREYMQQANILTELIDYRIADNTYMEQFMDVLIAKKYETMFLELEKPLFEAIKRAVHAEEKVYYLIGPPATTFFLKRAVLSDLPERLKAKAVEAAKTAHGEEYDVSKLLNDEVPLKEILNMTGIYSEHFFELNNFEFHR